MRKDDTQNREAFHIFYCCELRQKGKGVCLFKECPNENKKFHRLEGLSAAEYIEIIKIIGDVAPVRGI
jgi:predicted transcriptional regulator